jgi:hypothetical protein
MISYSSDDLDPQTACCPPTDELEDVSEAEEEEEEEPFSSPRPQPSRSARDDDDEGSSSSTSSSDDLDPPAAATTTQPLRSRDPRLLPEQRRALETRGAAAAADDPPPPPPPPSSFGLKLLALHRDLVKALTRTTGSSSDYGDEDTTTHDQLLDRLSAAASEALACPSLAAELAAASKRARRVTRRIQMAQKVANDAAKAMQEAAIKARLVVDEMDEAGGGHGGDGGPALPPPMTTTAKNATTTGKRRRRVQEEEEDDQRDHDDDGDQDCPRANANANASSSSRADRAAADAAVQARRTYVLSLQPLIPRFNSRSAQTTARAVSLTKKGGSSRFAHVYYLAGAWSAHVRRAGVQVPRALFHDEVAAAQAVDTALAKAGMPKVNKPLVELRRRLEQAGWFGVEDRGRRLGMLSSLEGLSGGQTVTEAEAEALRPIPGSWTRRVWRRGVERGAG